MLKALFLTAALLLAAALINHQAGILLVNTTSSLPAGLYLRLPSESAGRGDLVLFCLEEGPAAAALERGFIGRGRCPGGSAPLGKRVMAAGGDRVAGTPEGIYVNGELLENSRALARDGTGRPLEAWRFAGELAEDEFLLLNPRPRSYDGRYFGPVPRRALRGRLTPLITWN